MDYHSTINQSILAEFVEREVIMNASLLVEDLFECGRFDCEDIKNEYHYLCPECGGEMEEITDESNHVTGYTCTDCSHDQHQEPEQEAREIYEWWFVTEWLYQKLLAQGQ